MVIELVYNLLVFEKKLVICKKFKIFKIKYFKF